MNLTPLNRATTRRYRRCLAAGTHRAGDTMTRYARPWAIEYAPLPVCDNCGVPLPGPYVIFSLDRRRKRWAGKDDKEAA